MAGRSRRNGGGVCGSRRAPLSGASPLRNEGFVRTMRALCMPEPPKPGGTVTMSRATDALRRCFLTAGLEESQLETLASRTQRRHIAAGDVIFVEGEPGHEMFIIESGEVRISVKTPAGTPRTLATLYADESFGGLALLDGEPRSATATAVAATTLVALHRDDFVPVVHTDESALNAVMHSLAEMVRSMNRKLIDTGADAPSRIAKVLLDYHQRHGVAGEDAGSRIIKHPLSHADIASETGLTVAVIDKVLENYQYNSVLVRGPEYWTIVRLDVLNDAASNPSHWGD